MRRLLAGLNLTALLALSALAELILYRVLGAIFLPSQNGTAVERWAADAGLFASNFSGILALLLAVLALVHGLRSDQIFPRSMRITVSTVGVFFTVLAGLGVLWMLTPRYHVHMRISHGFLVFFLALGIWHGARSWRSKLAVTLFAIPIVLQAAALFAHRMAWSRLDPAQMLRVGHAIALAAMTATPVLLAPWPWRKARVAITMTAGTIIAAALSAATMLRFDLVQAVAYYGLRIDLTGLGSSAEQLYAGVLIAAFACLGATTVGCLLEKGKSRLAGWALLLLGVAGMEIGSPKPALFTLCGLLALAAATVQEERLTPPAERVPVPEA
jgi:succinate dehydrogenase hydrophobic anchor subunit